MKNLSPFHLAIPVNNIPKCKIFYKEILGCIEGRSSDNSKVDTLSFIFSGEDLNGNIEGLDIDLNFA